MSGIREIRDDFNAWHEQKYGGAPDPRAYPDPRTPPEPRAYPNPRAYDPRAYDSRHYDYRPPYRGDKYYDPYYYKKKKKTFLDRLEDLFD